MTIYEEFKGIIDGGKRNLVKDQELISKLDIRYNELEGETQDRLSRYKTFYRFFQGDQWFRTNRDADRHSYTNNMCEPVVTKYASLLMGGAPNIIVPRKSEQDYEADIAGFQGYGDDIPNFLIEENRSDILEKKLAKIFFKDNQGAKILFEGAKGGSIYGDTVFYIDFYEEKDTFKLETVFPGYVRAMFSINDYTKTDFVFVNHVVSIDSIYRKYKAEVTEDKTIDNNEIVWTTKTMIPGKYTVLKTYYDEDVKIMYVGDKILSAKKHNYSRTPFFFIRNRIDPFNPWGMSDLKDVISLQERLNTSVSNQADVIELFANPKIIGKNLTQRDVEAIKRAEGNVIPLRRDADLQPFEFRNNIYPIQQEITSVHQAINDISGLPPVFFGTAQGSIVTGVALTAQAAPTLQIVQAKALEWKERLEEMCAFMLEVLEERGGKLEVEKGMKVKWKEIIRGNYNTEIMTDIRAPKDDSMYIQNELNKMNFRAQSRTTTMQNLGINSPSNEMNLIAFEESHPAYTSHPEQLQAMNEKMNIPKDITGDAQLAFDENERIGLGEDIKAVASSLEGHELHAEIHARYAKEHSDDQDFMMAMDKHIAEHEIEIENDRGIPAVLDQRQKAPVSPMGANPVGAAGGTQYPSIPPEMASTMGNPQTPEGSAGQTVPLSPVSGGNSQMGL